MTFDTMRLIGGAGAFVSEWGLHASKCGVLVGREVEKKIYTEGVDILILDAERRIKHIVCHFDRKALWDSALN